MQKSDFINRARDVNSLGETEFWCEEHRSRSNPPKHTICLREGKYYVREYCYSNKLLKNCKVLYGPFDTWELAAVTYELIK